VQVQGQDDEQDKEEDDDKEEGDERGRCVVIWYYWVLLLFRTRLAPILRMVVWFRPLRLTCEVKASTIPASRSR
jgi:hypothetical protein